MILIKEKNRGEEKYIGKRRESRKSRITKELLCVVYTHGKNRMRNYVSSICPILLQSHEEQRK